MSAGAHLYCGVSIYEQQGVEERSQHERNPRPSVASNQLDGSRQNVCDSCVSGMRKVNEIVKSN